VNSEKIRPEHVQRVAFVYVRQSTFDQVRHHHESRRRQYDLAGHARELGWNQVVVIDEDLGKSGATAAGRMGFQRLVAEVSLGHAGAVFSLEVSRLARNNRDWYQLLDLCGLMNTLIVDAEGIYDPRLLNDRLLLGLKGTMSEAELGWIRQRAQEGLLAKARRGALILGLPVGYIQTRDGRVEKHPDQRVQHAIGLVFEKFTELGSVRQTLLWFRQEEVMLPSIAQEPTWGEQVTWRLPVYNTILNIVTNPAYGGAYVFGRRCSRTRVVEGRPHTTRGHRREREEWIALIRDHHDPYIPWETYERNRALVAHNAQMKGLMVKGAVRRGPSLLAGLVRCGHCGRRLHVTYSGTRGYVPRYSCRGAEVNHGAGRCIAFGGLRADHTIEQELLRVLQPAAIEAALAQSAMASEAADARHRALELELREARYEAERAQRQYDAVEPEHRLVAETLERRWNAALERVQSLERRLAALTAEACAQRTAPDRETLLALAHDVPRVWGDPGTDVRLKKRIVRLLIEEIIASVTDGPPPQITLVIHWTGGKHTQLVITRNRTGHHRHTTDRAVVDIVRDLARVQPDGQIARVLNRLGYRTGTGNAWTQQRVLQVRRTNQIAAFQAAAEHAGPLTLTAAAAALGVSPTAVRHLIERRVLPATQPVLHAPWAIQRDDLQRETVQRIVAAIKQGHAVPRTGSPDQLTFDNSRR
jgi:DNA invertase Pin-like site-specific DNA recombinase